MIRTAFDRIVLIDTSAAIALLDSTEARHEEVSAAYHHPTVAGTVWAVLDLTSHECFTTTRYKVGLESGIAHYQFLRSNAGVQLYRFAVDDEASALALLRRYSTVRLSFHDAICAAAMKRIGIYKILSLDGDFRCFGFEVLPY